MCELAQEDTTPAVPSEQFLSRLSSFSASPKRSTSASPVPAKRVKLSPSQQSPPAKRVLKPGQGRYKKGVKKSYKVYPELKPLPDKLVTGLDIVWVGINPGKCSAEKGHSFANPTNRFWTYLHKSGCTSEKLKPEADVTLAETHNMSITNFIARPTSAEAELSKEEWLEAVPLFMQKMQTYQPQIIACLGKRVFTTLQSALAKPTRSCTSSYFPTKPKVATKVVMGLQNIRFTYESGQQTIIFALPSPSGLETHYQGEPSIKLFGEVKALSDRLKAGEGLTEEEEAGMLSVNVDKWIQGFNKDTASETTETKTD